MNAMYFYILFGFAPMVLICALFDWIIFGKMMHHNNKELKWYSWIPACFIEMAMLFSGILIGIVLVKAGGI